MNNNIDDHLKNILSLSSGGFFVPLVSVKAINAEAGGQSLSSTISISGIRTTAFSRFRQNFSGIHNNSMVGNSKIVIGGIQI